LYSLIFKYGTTIFIRNISFIKNKAPQHATPPGSISLRIFRYYKYLIPPGSIGIIKTTFRLKLFKMKLSCKTSVGP